MKACTKCGVEKPLEAFHRRARSKDGRAFQCSDCARALSKRWREENPEQYRASIAAWREKNPDKRKVQVDRGRARAKLECLSHYSGGEPVCACCGEKCLTFLTLDHVNNDGAEHRRFRKRRDGIYAELRREGYPAGYQVLCWNCNWGKHAHGVCPHQACES